MLMGLLALLILVTAPLTGGRLTYLARLEVRGFSLLPIALSLQVLVITVFPDWPRSITITTHALTYALAAYFIWLNGAVPGLPILGLGGGMNGLGIAANGGTLPASRDALATAGLGHVEQGFTNSNVLSAPRLSWLGDNSAIPDGVPLANVFSLGDVVILVGATVLVHTCCRTERRHSSVNDRATQVPQALTESPKSRIKDLKGAMRHAPNSDWTKVDVDTQ